MRYMGGKYKIADALVKCLLEKQPNLVYEPFCGALNISITLLKKNPNIRVVASDKHTALIDMWKAVQDGWIPPENLSSEEYYFLKNQPDSPLRTFAGYGCSFSGVWFGSYAKDASGRNYCKNAHKSIIKMVDYINKIDFKYGDYASQNFEEKQAIIYCDPPYAGTSLPGNREKQEVSAGFDSSAFWSWVSNQRLPCYVSEYKAPEGLHEIWSKPIKLEMKAAATHKVEKLFYNGR